MCTPRLALLLSLSSLLGLTAVGCSDPPPPPDPMAVIGNYTIMIEANGKMDPDTMYVTTGSNNNVLLTFLDGISQIRGTLVGSTELTLPRQTITVNHSTGVAEGVGDGTGLFTIDATTKMASDVDFTVSLNTPGFGPADGGGGGAAGMGVVEYHVTGTRQ